MGKVSVEEISTFLELGSRPSMGGRIIVQGPLVKHIKVFLENQFLEEVFPERQITIVSFTKKGKELVEKVVQLFNDPENGLSK